MCGHEERPGAGHEGPSATSSKAVNVEMVLTNSKRYDSKSNGKVEKAIQEVEEHVRTFKLHTEERIGKTIPSDHPIIHWMVEYAAETINRFKIIKTKLTLRGGIRGNAH